MSLITSVRRPQEGTHTLHCFDGQEVCVQPKPTHSIVIPLTPDAAYGTEQRQLGWARRGDLPICPEHKRDTDSVF